MAVADAYRLSMYQTLVGQRVMNTLAFDRKGVAPPTLAECLALANDWKDAIKAQQSASLNHVSWKMEQLSGTGVTYPSGQCKKVGGLVFDGLYTGVTVGSLAGVSSPPQIAVVTTIMTGLSGRTKRGRFYMPGLLNSSHSDGTVGSGNVTALQTLWDAQGAQYFDAGSDAIWRIGVWSQTIATGCKPGAAHPHDMTEVVAPSPATAFTAANGFKVRNICYTQRRRTIGVGA